ncbi:hypothetical protein [Spirosoma telluris]|uniref:hypothetical protein n=1 Tax=Spirosoma telluris TaxID=2183553 RepID=UPI001313E939
MAFKGYQADFMAVVQKLSNQNGQDKWAPSTSKSHLSRLTSFMDIVRRLYDKHSFTSSITFPDIAYWSD